MNTKIYENSLQNTPWLAAGSFTSEVVAMIDVKDQKVKLFLDKTQVDEFNYKLQ